MPYLSPFFRAPHKEPTTAGHGGQVSRLAATCVPGAPAYSWRINECSAMKYCARRDVAPQVLNRVYRKQ
eukprot:gene9897-biopygen4743